MYRNGIDSDYDAVAAPRGSHLVVQKKLRPKTGIAAIIFENYRMYCIEQTQSIRHSPFRRTLYQCGMENKRLILEIRSVLDGREKESRALEQRLRWLKFADLALRNQGLAPNAQDLDELADLSRAEQEHIKGRIDYSVKNYQRLKEKGNAKTLRNTA